MLRHGIDVRLTNTMLLSYVVMPARGQGMTPVRLLQRRSYKDVCGTGKRKTFDYADLELASAYAASAAVTLRCGRSEAGSPQGPVLVYERLERNAGRCWPHGDARHFGGRQICRAFGRVRQSGGHRDEIFELAASASTIARRSSRRHPVRRMGLPAAEDESGQCDHGLGAEDSPPKA